MRTLLDLVVPLLFVLGCAPSGSDPRATAPTMGTTTAPSVSTTAGDLATSRRAFPPRADRLQQGDRVYGVFVAVERTSTAPELAQAKSELEKVGYAVGAGVTDINCDQGAREALGLDVGRDYYSVAVYFRTAEQAQQFVDAFQPGVVGTAAVTVYCRD